MKTILITGSTDGIGKLTARQLAKEGHQIVLHGRNSEKLEKTISELKKQTSNDQLTGYVSDLADFDNIVKMSTNISNEFSKLDVLINNAGVFKSNIQSNSKGLDLRFAVNYFAPYLLTNELLPILKNSSSPRIINLSSAAQASVSIEALKGNAQLSEQEAYAQSKLALTIWSFYFAKTHPEITTIAVNPGSLLNTKMVQEAYGRYWSSADKGAKILCELAVEDHFSSKSGTYYDNDNGDFNEAHPDVYRQEKIATLISETKSLLKQ